MARLFLDNGNVFSGQHFGAEGTVLAELVFNTSCTGYQEILTDPSYCGQMILMTSPEMGNYGIHHDDVESESGQVYAKGLVIRRLSALPSSWRSDRPLEGYLKEKGCVGIQGVDTRAITRQIRTHGTMKALITSNDALSPAEATAMLAAHPGLDGQDLVSQVTTPKAYFINGTAEKPRVKTLALIDLGMKQNIVRSFQPLVGRLHVFPASVGYSELMSIRPDAVFFSNGPGDPTILHQPIALATQLIAEKVPTFGICLGHQILALASGGKVEKMRFGHHGGNHPVKDLETGAIAITSQNHGYALIDDALPPDITITHVNLNDQSVEGFRHTNAPVFSVQFHPEASPGPHDAAYLFERFLQVAY